MRLIKFLVIVIVFVCIGNGGVYAQLRKAAEVEKVKSFTNGSVTLHKVKTTSGEIYSVTLKNNSALLDNVVFYLGDKETMLKNLKELSAALAEGKKGDVFDFSACGKDYHLVYGKVLGQVCFKVSTPTSISSDFGRFYKATMDDILEYFKESSE